MIERTIGQIESQINQTRAATKEQKHELLRELAELKSEVSKLAKTHEDHAHSITGFAAVSTHEATRPDQNPQLRDLSVRGLRSTVEGFEESHPQLVQIVNNISNRLANFGI